MTIKNIQIILFITAILIWFYAGIECHAQTSGGGPTTHSPNYWQRSGTTLSPIISGDNISTTGNFIGANNGIVNYTTITCSGSSGQSGQPVSATYSTPYTFNTYGKIVSATLAATSGGGGCTITVDVWKLNAGVPTISNSITSSTPPKLNSGTYYQDLNLSGWTTTISPNDTFVCNVESSPTPTCASFGLVLGIAK